MKNGPLAEGHPLRDGALFYGLGKSGKYLSPGAVLVGVLTTGDPLMQCTLVDAQGLRRELQRGTRPPRSLTASDWAFFYGLRKLRNSGVCLRVLGLA